MHDAPVTFLCFSINNWETRRARKQQFMLHLSLRDDVAHVYYVEPPLSLYRLIAYPIAELRTRDSRRRWFRALTGAGDRGAAKLTVLTPLFIVPGAYRSRLLYGVDLALTAWRLRIQRRVLWRRTVLWLYHPSDRPVLSLLPRCRVTVFDWAEKWSDYFPGMTAAGRAAVDRDERALAASVDIVFTVSRYLRDLARVRNARSYQLFDGTSPDLFSAPLTTPSDLAPLRRPRVLFSGTVGHRFDVDLVTRLSDALPDATLVLLGNISLPDSALRALRARASVHLLGVRSFADLPAYLCSCDVCIIPYRFDPETPAPTKIFDYLAAGKPIVSTYCAELERFRPLVTLAGTPEEFIAAVRRACTGGTDGDAQTRRQLAAANSWDVRAAEIMEHLFPGHGASR